MPTNPAMNAWPFSSMRRPDGEPLMIPPTVMKQSLDEALRSQWAGASNAIADADAIWFIGYSFPETDSFMRFFLAAALGTNAGLKQLLIIDPNADACRRAKSLFQTPFLRDVFRMMPSRWNWIENFHHLLSNDLRSAVGNYHQFEDDEGLNQLERMFRGEKIDGLP
jgi:hypothetical protein